MNVTVTQMSDGRRKFEREWGALCRHARENSSDLVLLPEMPFSSWFCSSPKFDPEAWEGVVEEHREWTGRLGELGAPMVLGTSPVDKRGKRFNEGFVWTKAGLRGVQLKNYLPNGGGYYEASWYHRGDRKFSKFKAGRLTGGFMICSDLWSMSSARAFGKEGVQVIASPRATGSGSLEKWLAGGKVAAVVSGAYSISSNRVGKKGEAVFGGMGWAIDPDGGVLGTTSEEEPFVTVEVDLKKADEAKKTYPRDSLEPD